MIIELFNKKIKLNDHYCQLNNNPLIKIEKPYINLYVQLKNCNANCLFCEYKNNSNDFNIDKYKFFINKLSKQIEIRKISFTGGEPTLDYNKLIEIVNLSKKKLKSFFVLNTNGYNLKKLVDSLDYLLFDSISLSRHSYNDNDNDNILGYISPKTEYLKEYSLKLKDRLHLSCNIIKNYIDNEQEIYNYLEWVDSIGYDDVGFVSLMKINNFCKNNFIDFDKLFFDKLNLIKKWNNIKSCRCNNYLYISNKNNIIKIYNRHVYSKSNTNNFIFDGENFKNGFDGDVIF